MSPEVSATISIQYRQIATSRSKSVTNDLHDTLPIGKNLLSLFLALTLTV